VVMLCLLLPRFTGVLQARDHPADEIEGRFDDRFRCFFIDLASGVFIGFVE